MSASPVAGPAPGHVARVTRKAGALELYHDLRRGAARNVISEHRAAAGSPLRRPTGPRSRPAVRRPPLAAHLTRRHMIERHMALADMIARRYRHTSEPLEDLVQVARLGLIKAVDRWDPDRGTAFTAFAVPTITGELRRYFRDRTWTVRPPRDVQDLYLDVRRMRESLVHELRREPTARDVAAELGRTVEEVLDALQAGDAHSPASLDTQVTHDDEGGGQTWLDRVPDARDEIDCSEKATALRQLGTVLDDRAWEVIRLRFDEDLMQREIGERIGCSQMQVSRILRDSLARLSAAAREANLDFD
jgi:RNA polymerase sigma-B factor